MFLALPRLQKHSPNFCFRTDVKGQSSSLILLVFLFFSHAALAQKSAAPNEDQIQAVIVLARHGVRAPIESETRSSAYNAQPWPAWPAAPGVLTSHGAEALKLLGEYYRSRYPSLLQHVPCDHRGIYVEANTTQRTVASGKAMISGLAPDCRVDVHVRTNAPNPLFEPSSSSFVDHRKVGDATLGRMANQPAWFTNAFFRPLGKMHHVLADCSGVGCDPSKPDFRTVTVDHGLSSPRDAHTDNPVALGADFAENFLLEYTEGLPMSQVGWGRVDREDLNDLMEMNTRYHDFMLRTPYEAQVAASDLAAHLRDTIISIVSGVTVAGQLGTPQDHFFLLDGHDSNLSWLGGLLHLDWLLPDQTFNATPPGSALVFEVHYSELTHVHTVQIFFISQTLDQIRFLKPLTATEQPSVGPVFVPGCSGPAPAYACSVEDFTRVITTAIDPRFVESGSTGSTPSKELK
ncbi:histidine-type phosphatase [Granulicella sp. S156]|uniref:histidine-type phosphatase n=1 Tax=Granulicella sp. S156 TaxID=1747224 RepID=UPI00131BD8D3|nr:histidine-type phosphatase [Granulicella sp. S156]